MLINRFKEKGSVSLFVVIFAALLITIVTVSFVRIMIQDQQQASSSDLSQSAYDSAQAGVEDAKRALLRYQSLCSSGDIAGCDAARNSIDSATCNKAVEVLSDVKTSNNEVKVESGGSNSLDQAYTCVKINLQTDDYLGSLAQDSSKLIPLVGSSEFKSIHIEWFGPKDLQGTGMKIDVPSISGTPLLAQNSWVSNTSPNRPSIMSTQLMQFNSKTGFILSDLNSGDESKGSSHTLFLYPSNIVDSKKQFTDDFRNKAKALAQVNCKSDLTGGGYACSATIELPEAIKVGDRTAYLNLTSLYKKSSYRITLLDSSSGEVKFDGVQPEIDSTGRANNLFRRVKSRVELVDANFPYPEAEVDITGNFCKNFRVTDAATDYQNSCN